MFKLGLTGSIATGKSTALAEFAALGHEVFSADDAVHSLYEGAAVAPISAVFPEAVKEGKVDRQVLSAILLSTPERLQELNSIVHPLVRAKIANFMVSATKNRASLAVVDIPLLFETGHDYGLDGVALTWCSDEIQRTRALARPQMSVEKLNIILAHQMSQSEKKQRADFLIDTSGSLEQTKKQVAHIAEFCISRAQQGPLETLGPEG